jgi:hypothetical protein
MFRIDDHIGIAIAGLTSDARVLRYALPTSLTTSDAPFFSHSRVAISCASKPWAPRWCSTDPSPSTDSYPPSPTVRRVPLLHSCGEADAPYQRPKSILRNTAGVHTASVSLSSGWTTQDHTCTSSRRAAPHSSTSPSRSVRAVRVPRPTSRSTSSPLTTVRFPFLFILSADLI